MSIEVFLLHSIGPPGRIPKKSDKIMQVHYNLRQTLSDPLMGTKIRGFYACAPIEQIPFLRSSFTSRNSRFSMSAFEYQHNRVKS